MSAFDTVATEQTGFELERFQWSGADRLEVEGRWFGVRGRRFVRPVLTVQVRGRRRRLLAVLEHKPWQAEETESWIAAFPWEGSRDDVGEAELEVGALTVDLPPPGGSQRRRHRPASAEPAPGAAEPARAAEADQPPLTDRRTASETRHQVERDLAGTRAELGRLRQRHEEESRELRASVREASDEAARLREELQREREGRGTELDRLRESDAEARAEADRHRAEASTAAEAERQREEAAAASAELERQREEAAAASAELEQLREAASTAAAEAERLREARQEALAENQRLRQATRKASAEAERLRAASRRPGAPRPAPADAAAKPAGGPPPEPRRSPDAQATVPFQVVADEPDDDATVRMPPPTVRRIPRGQPAEAAGGEATPPPREVAPRPAGERRTAAIRGRPEPGAGSARLLGELPRRRSTLEIWGPRLAAFVLVALLLLALALIVRGLL